VGLTEADACHEYVTPALQGAGFGGGTNLRLVGCSRWLCSTTKRPFHQSPAQQRIRELSKRVVELKAEHFTIREANAALRCQFWHEFSVEADRWEFRRQNLFVPLVSS
jgi:hypothetical protein